TGGTAGSQWQRTGEVRAYDTAGRPIEQADAHGEVMRFGYGRREGGCPTTNAPLAIGSLTCVAKAGLFRAVHYDEVGRVEQILDSNGAGATYAYDEHGRVVRTHNALGQLLSETTYGLGVPFRVSTVEQAAPADERVSHTFYDGLGRVLQTQVREAGNAFTVTHAEYDALGRVTASWKPYRHATSGQFDSAPAQHHGYGAGTSPFTETIYAIDGTGRPGQLIPPHAGAAPSRTLLYRVRTFDGHAYATVESADENGRLTWSYVDAFEQVVRTVEAVGTPDEASTSFAFDAAGRLLSVTPPNGSAYATRHRYDTMGRRIESTSPDADGTWRWRYDALGQQRLGIDPNGTVQYTRYDAVSRVVETGAVTANFDGTTQAQLDNPAWPASGVSDVHRYQYDGYSSVLPAPTGADPSFARERLTGVEHEAGRVRYAYDAEGRLTAEDVCLEDLDDCAAFRYAYDRLGSVTEQSYTAGADRLHHHYAYDEAGRLETVETALADGGLRTREASYLYDDAGRLGQLHLGQDAAGHPIQTVDYTYDLRDWVRSINDPDAPADDLFALELGYENMAPFATSPQLDGAVTWAKWRTSGVQSAGHLLAGPVSGYSYDYDARGRLTSADYSHQSSAGAWQDNPSFDVTGVRYDGNSNPLGFTRRMPATQGLAGSVDIFQAAPVYAPGTNRMCSLDGSTCQAPGAFVYDANGNQRIGRLGHTLEYNRHNQVISAQTGAGVSSYAYDVDGRRVVTTAPDGRRTFHLRDHRGTVRAVYSKPPTGPAVLKHFNVVADGRILARIEPASL
ncbi:MAG: DUF6443 domain-containing protein, partial [Bacteroidota bacterium]